MLSLSGIGVSGEKTAIPSPDHSGFGCVEKTAVPLPLTVFV
jgi:hypothetical protein